MAGGFRGEFDSTVLVLRQSEGKRSAAKFDVSDIQKGRAEDPTLQAGDVNRGRDFGDKEGFQLHIEGFAPRRRLFAIL